MNNIFNNNENISGLYIGALEAEKVYVGGTLVYENSPTPPPSTYKARLTLTGGTTVDIPTNGSSTLTRAETSAYSATCVAVEITTAVTSIDQLVFASYRYITSIDIPDSVTSISGGAFQLNDRLTRVSIGSGLASLGDYNFHSSGITTITVNSNNTVYDSRNNCNAIIQTATNTLMIGCSTTVIPNNVTSIGNSAFYSCSNLSSITIPNSVITIGDSAFSYCPNLTSITIPDSVTTIGNSIVTYDYNEGTGTTELVIGSGITSVGETEYIPYIFLKTTNFEGYPCSFRYVDNEITPTVYDANTGDEITVDWCNDCDWACGGGESEYLNFTARNGDATISMTGSATPNVSYSFDGTNWTTWDYSNLTIPNGSTLYMKGNNPNGFNTATWNYKKFTMSGTVEANGNIMSLLYDDDFEGQLTIPSNYCFCRLFQSCTSLTTAPELPATSLTRSCYSNMFAGCTSLTSALELPATTLELYCYQQMFNSCTSLNYIKMMATDISASGCLDRWVSGVAASGTFVKNANATWDVSGDSGVPSGWTIQYETPN